MKPLQVLIIDDEPLAHKVIIEYARDLPFLEISAQAHLATEALGILRRQPIDLIFLDINMPRLQGLDFLRSLQRPPLVIITSAYQEYALESFELNVVDYLLKPFAFDRFLKAVNKAVELYQLKSNPTSSTVSSPARPESSTREPLFIKVDKRFVSVNPAEIYHLDSYGNYVKVWLGEHYHLTPRTLASFEQQLSTDEFLRIHKSHMINRRFIEFIEGNQVKMKNGHKLPIGKNYRSTMKGLFS